MLKSVSLEDADLRCLEKQVPLDRITVSSDSNGSIPHFDDQGKLLGLTIATQEDLLEKLRVLVKKKILSLPDSLRLFSTNSAHFYKFDQKGEIQAGKDADMLLLDKDHNLTDSFARGQRMLAEGKLMVRSTFHLEKKRGKG